MIKHVEMFREDPDCMTHYIRTPSTDKDGIDGLNDILMQLQGRPAEMPTIINEVNEVEDMKGEKGDK